MANNNLTKAKKAKNDEFYTQFIDIQKEVEAYLEYDSDVFRGKVVYCNCDDPYESNFFRYFVLNFDRIGLKQLITTSYKPSPIANTQLGLFGDDETLTKQKGRPKVTANKFIINSVGDTNNDGEFNLKDISLQLQQNKNNEWTPLKENGDFRSAECIDLLKQADIVITNPPFSLFREYVAQLIEYQKQFLIIGNINAITYRETFPLIKENKMWLGATNFNQGMYFQVPDEFVYADSYKFEREQNGVKVNRVPGVCWFTNLDHGRRHQPLSLMSEKEVIKFSTKKPFDKYDNYDAIEIGEVKQIPSDYAGVMGVPITFLDKFCPEQFEILGLGISNSGIEIGVQPYKKEHKKYRKEVQKRGAVDGDLYMVKNNEVKVPYARILIKHKNPTRKK